MDAKESGFSFVTALPFGQIYSNNTLIHFAIHVYLFRNHHLAVFSHCILVQGLVQANENCPILDRQISRDFIINS